MGHQSEAGRWAEREGRAGTGHGDRLDEQDEVEEGEEDDAVLQDGGLTRVGLSMANGYPSGRDRRDTIRSYGQAHYGFRLACTPARLWIAHYYSTALLVASRGQATPHLNCKSHQARQLWYPLRSIHLGSSGRYSTARPPALPERSAVDGPGTEIWLAPPVVEPSAGV